MSLRARLIGGLLALAALGLLLLGGITYAEQRSFHYERIDRQAMEGIPAVARALGGHTPFERHRPPPRGGHGGGPPGRGPVSLPPGTYGQSRDAQGEVTNSVVLSFGQTATTTPDIPEELEPGELRTVGSDGGDRYRVYSQRTGTGSIVIAVPLGEVDDTLRRLLLVEGLVIGGVLLALGALSWWLVGIGLRPLDRIAATAGAIAAGDLSKRVDDAHPRTEVGRLSRALNTMLARLEEAFAARKAGEENLRRFLSDASHELRTPLASIRGYAELFRIGAARDEEDVAKAMRRIEEEATRMGVLVDDLLALARLDEVPELVREEVDVARLAADAADDGRAVDPDRPIAVRGATRAIVEGDRDRLRQVLANLMRNALVHTPPGTPIDIEVDVDGPTVRIHVRDHGPGLPPGVDPQELFRRFYRPESGRARGKAGAGLGLAIVAAVAAAHDGRAVARNAEGGGARFTIELPAANGWA